MAGEQFSLCWDNFHKNMSSGMHSLLESEDLVDVTLAVEGKYLKAHKMVLSVCSPYFRELFHSNPCKHPIVFMKDVSYLALSDLLTFMYQGEVQVNQDNLATFIKTAEALQIKGLTGDGNGEVGEIPEVSSPAEQNPKRTIHEIDDVQTPRAKKPVTCPTNNRPKPQSASEMKIPKTETISLPGTPSAEQIIQLKMEPYENVDHSNVESTDDSQVVHFVDESIDDGHMDDAEDYSMLEGEEEPQAGTSGDAVGDSQAGYSVSNGDERKPVIQKLRKYHRIVQNGFFYNISTTRYGNKRYYRCANKKLSGCLATAVLERNAAVSELKILRPHNHPSDKMMEMKYNFERDLTRAVRSTNAPIKTIYDSLAEIYPEAAKLLPYHHNLGNKLKRRRFSPHNMYP